MPNLLGYLVRVISNTDKDGNCTGKTVRLLPITDEHLEFDIPYEGDETLGILKAGETHAT